MNHFYPKAAEEITELAERLARLYVSRRFWRRFDQKEEKSSLFNSDLKQMRQAINQEIYIIEQKLGRLVESTPEEGT